MTPLISVVIPAYKCAGVLRYAIDSALIQDVPLEVLVIDDCSGEDLEPVLACYREDPRVRYFRNPENLGAAQTRNRGVELAEGRYIAFLDADDVWRPGKLKLQLQLLEESGAVLCCTSRELMDFRGTPTGRVLPVPRKITYRTLLRHNCIACSSVVMRREAALEFPMHHADSHEDYIMWLEILRKYDLAVGIPDPLLLYRVSATGKSGSKLHSAKMTWMVYRYMGFGPLKSAACFASYAVNGVWKHFLKI